MRTEIEKQQTKRTIVHFSCQERDKKEKNKNKSIIGDNSTITRLHVPHHVKESTTAHSGDDGLSELVIERHHTHCLNDADVTHSLVYMEHASIAFLLKNKT